MSTCHENLPDADLVIVDDDALVLELVTRKLRRTDIRVHCFSDTEAAIEYLENHTTRVLIVDQRMPAMSGLCLLQRVVAGDANRSFRSYLCSAIPLPTDVCERAEEIGVCPLSKDVYRDAAGLLALFDTGH